MDSEHRHELAENDLARILKDFGAKFEGFGGPIVAGCIAVLAIVIGFAVVRGQSAATSKEAWKKLASATIPENFETVADDYPDTEIAAWAKVNQGRLSLQEGIRDAFQDRESSQRAFADAKGAYEAALGNPAAPEEVREKALFGLATYEEAVSTGDTAAAIAAYQRLVDEFPNGGSRKYAAQRIETLQTDSAKEFYAWFSEQEPKRELGGAPNDGIGINSPFSTPPTADDTDTEMKTDTASETADEPLGDNPFEDLKSDDGADEKMADEKMADESAKATDEKTTDEKTTDEKAADKGDATKTESSENTPAEAKAEMKESEPSKKADAPTEPKLPAPTAETTPVESTEQAATEAATTEASASDANE